MRSSGGLRWAVVAVIVCGAVVGSARAEEGGLEQAKKEMEEVKRLEQSGKYADAIPLAEHALQIRDKALGKEHLDVAECLHRLGTLYLQQGNYARSELLLQRAFHIREAALGKVHSDVAATLNSLALLYQNQGEYQRAESLFQRAFRILEAVLGKNHPHVAALLNNLAALYQNQGEYQRAEPLFQRALQIREAALGKAHPNVAHSLNNLAALYHRQGEYQRAESLYKRALQIRKATLGEKHPDVANSLNSLAALYQDQGEYQRAEPLFQRALQIWEAALGEEHPHVAQSLNNLGILYRNQGAYQRAEQLFQRALRIRETALGKEHPDVAQSLNNLANLYRDEGAYQRAESLFQRALQIWEMALGKEHPDVANSLANLAILYIKQGAYQRAEPLFQRALRIKETALGKEHPDVAASLNNLAALYADQGAYQRAEPLYHHALQIRETALGKDHPDVAKSLANLADLYADQGAYQRAESLYQRALQILEAALGTEHPDFANSLNNLAALYADQGGYQRAEPLYQRALQIWEAALGKAHPEVVNPIHGLALLNVAQNHFAAAWPLFKRAFTISEQRLRNEALNFSEERLADFITLLRERDEKSYNLLREQSSELPARRLALTAALLHKGRSAGELADISQSLYQRLGQADRERFDHLKALRTQLSTLSLKGQRQLSTTAYQALVKNLKTQADTIEGELAKHSAIFRAQRQRPQPAEVIQKVASTLPSDGALIEIIAFDQQPVILPPGAIPSKVPTTPVYVALILLPNGDIQFADLGPAAPIDDAAARLHEALENRHLNHLELSQALYRLVFQPIVPLLGAQRRLFLSPDGQLNLAAFAALHDGTRFLIDTYDFVHLTSGMDLLRRPGDIAPSHSVVAVVDPDFTATPAPAAPPVTPAALPATDAPSRSLYLEELTSQLQAQAGRTTLPPLLRLPGTRREAEVIHTLFPQTRILAGAQATKQALLALDAPGILHIGTHGLVLAAPTAPDASPGRSRGIPREVFDLGDSGPVPNASPDPLMRAFLVLAGIAAPVPANAADLRIQNSLATALELAGMNLWGTQLVVISTCVSGAGKVELGQGVYGLRRAFTVAGAETVVSSLWKVDDMTTASLMTDFYQHLAAGEGRAEAMRQAMQTARANPRTAHPYYWAPFIVIGNDAPLRGFGLPAPATTTR